jgi:transcriptional regulator with XRE-family HTH domain
MSKEHERGSPAQKELCQILIERRRQAGLSQRGLALRLGWDPKTIAGIESGSKRLGVLELIAIADALDFDAPSVVRRVVRKQHAAEE